MNLIDSSDTNLCALAYDVVTANNQFFLQERIQAMSQESAWDKVKRLASGRTRAEVHYDAAKDAAGDASGHLTQVGEV